jgi:hypothetical protein
VGESTFFAEIGVPPPLILTQFDLCMNTFKIFWVFSSLHCNSCYGLLLSTARIRTFETNLYRNAEVTDLQSDRTANVLDIRNRN